MIDEKKLIKDYCKTMCGSEPCEISIACETIKLIDSQPKVGEWIPVSERLPGEHIGVNVTVETSKSARYTGNGWLQDGLWVLSPFLTWGRVVAWQPLPEPYKEEEEL